MAAPASYLTESAPSCRLEETSPFPQPYRFTVEEYYRMGEAGIFSEDDRVELLDGQIVMMPPIDPGHAEGTHNSEKLLDRLLAERCQVRCQHPVRLGPKSEPVPDVAVVKHQSYKDRHPTPADTYLIIEVANSSLAEDLNYKRLLYATAGIPEYWVLDIVASQLHAFARPSDGDYQDHRILEAHEETQSSVLPILKVPVRDLLP
ncbi:MAG TPA: Uma2 family endonuclease [Prosthecobacter sp.]|nr:Uma2 family endonuclease [Prosthecobacter sp.]